MKSLPNDTALLPVDPATALPLEPRQQPGYYPGYRTLDQRAYWDAATRDVVLKRVESPPPRRFFTEAEWNFWTVVFDHLVPQNDRTPDRRISLLAPLDDRLQHNRTEGYRYEDMPQDRDVYREGIAAIDAESEAHFGQSFLHLSWQQQDLVLAAIHDAKPAAPSAWQTMSIHRFWQMILGDAIEAYYSHPWAWDEIGFGGPAYPRAYTRLERGEPEPWEVEEQRYAWEPPAIAASAKTAADGDEHQSHHGSGGAH